MKIYYNTSTGNSLYVAKLIRDKFKDCEIVSINKALRDKDLDASGEDIIGFIYPIHCGGLPIVVNDFISKINISANSYLFAIGVTGGGGADMSFGQINQLLRNKIKLSNYCTIKYISNYIRAGRNPTEERAKTSIKNSENVLIEFIESLKKKEVKRKDFKCIIGNIGYKLWKDYFKRKDKNFNVNEKCIQCNICVKVCPVDNIIMENNKPKWHGKCTDCMACINLCPKGAINIGKSTHKKNRYKNPYIKREELI